MKTSIEIQTCEVCGSHELTPVLDLGNHPMCDDLIPVGEPCQCERFAIEILYCRKCDTAHQRYQVPKGQLFPKNYHYRSRFTTDVLSGMAALVDSVELRSGSLAGKTVLDVGCNDGSLLDKFAAKGARTVGVEPTGAYTDALGRSHVILNDYFSEETAHKIFAVVPRVDIITFTNVFAHIEDLPALLKTLALVMNDETLLIVENHYLGAVLDHNQFDTFYHEHPRTYSLHSFQYIARALGREVSVVEFPERYGGNIRVMIGPTQTPTPKIMDLMESTRARETSFFGEFATMRDFIINWRQDKKAEIKNLVQTHGKLLAKAFPGRAAILVALLELSTEEVECVYEKPGSLKVGHYVPGTRIPIRSDEELFRRLGDTKMLLNLAWHIPAEIDEYLRKNGFKGQLVNII